MSEHEHPDTGPLYPPPVPDLGSIPKRVNGHLDSGYYASLEADARRQDEPADPLPGDPAYEAEAFTAISLNDLEPYEWVYRNFLVARFFCALGAPPGTGKTALIVAIALSIATGRALLGGDAPEQGNVWIINLEDPREALLKLIWAACEYYKIEPAELEGRVFVNSGRDRPLVVARQVDGFTLRCPVVGELRDSCLRREIKALFVDPVVDTHNLNENDNLTMNDYCMIWNELAQDCNLAVLLSMHFRKGGMAGDPDAFRGASAVIGKARSAITLGQMSEADAGKLGVQAETRAYHLRLDNAKRNLSAPPMKADWLRLESVDLPMVGFEKRDSIQVLSGWIPPSPWENISTAAGVRMLELIEAGDGGEYYTNHRRGRANDRWAGRVILEYRERGPVTEEQAAMIVAEWLRDGTLIAGMYHSPSTRREQSCVRVDPDKLAVLRARAEAMLPNTETPWDC